MLFDENGLIWGPVLGLHEVASDPQAEALGLFPTVDHPERGAYRTVAMPMRFHTADVGPRRPAPELGADTLGVLSRRRLHRRRHRRPRRQGHRGV